MATFAELKSEVLTLVIDTPTSVQGLVGKFVNRALKKLQQKHNFKVMEYGAAFTTVVGTHLLGPVPPLWKETRGKAIVFWDDMSKPRELGWTTPSAEARVRFGDDPDIHYGAPRTLVNNNISGTFGVYPYPDGLSLYSDGEYRISISYWTYLADLAADADANWFTSNAEQYIIFTAVSDAFFADHDENNAILWKSRAQAEYADILLTDKVSRFAETQSFVPHLGARMPHTEE